jgi:hypothetical protein
MLRALNIVTLPSCYDVMLQLDLPTKYTGIIGMYACICSTQIKKGYRTRGKRADLNRPKKAMYLSLNHVALTVYLYVI